MGKKSCVHGRIVLCALFSETPARLQQDTLFTLSRLVTT